MAAHRTVNLTNAFDRAMDRYDSGLEDVLDIRTLIARLRTPDNIILTVEGGRAVIRSHGQLYFVDAIMAEQRPLWDISDTARTTGMLHANIERLPEPRVAVASA
jgi:hypothetical protein